MAYKSNQESAFKKFLNENKSLAFMLPVLVVLVIVLIIVYSGIFSKDASQASSDKSDPALTPQAGNAVSGQPQVEVLPQIVRATTESAAKVVKDPFESPMKLKGIIYSEERSTAIIETGGISYIVELNDAIGDSAWKVVQIETDSITLESDAKSIVLELTDSAVDSQGQ